LLRKRILSKILMTKNKNNPRSIIIILSHLSTSRKVSPWIRYPSRFWKTVRIWTLRLTRKIMLSLSSKLSFKSYNLKRHYLQPWRIEWLKSWTFHLLGRMSSARLSSSYSSRLRTCIW
jgi:hypothetical protein